LSRHTESVLRADLGILDVDWDSRRCSRMILRQPTRGPGPGYESAVEVRRTICSRARHESSSDTRYGCRGTSTMRQDLGWARCPDGCSAYRTRGPNTRCGADDPGAKRSALNEAGYSRRSMLIDWVQLSTASGMARATLSATQGFSSPATGSARGTCYARISALQCRPHIS